MKEIEITSLQAGQRLDHLLSRYLKEAHSGFLYRMLRKKNITLNGHKAQGCEKLTEGDVVRLFFSDETLMKLTGMSEAGRSSGTGSPGAAGGSKSAGRRLDILYEDEDVLLVNKPAGMLTQKARPEDISLNEIALDHLLSEGALTREDLLTFRPSVCNRLDRNTSGIVAVGKTVAGLQALSAMFRDRSVRKYYQALVTGEVKEEKLIDGWLIKDEKTNTVKILPAEAKDARRILTRYIPEETIRLPELQQPLTLLSVELLTGRSHQIRAHLSSAGHAIAGDPKYGSRKVNDIVRRKYGVKRQLLHAGRLTFPEMEGRLKRLSGRTFLAHLPEDFQRITEAAAREDRAGRQ